MFAGPQGNITYWRLDGPANMNTSVIIDGNVPIQFNGKMIIWATITLVNLDSKNSVQFGIEVIHAKKNLSALNSDGDNREHAGDEFREIIDVGRAYPSGAPSPATGQIINL